ASIECWVSAPFQAGFQSASISIHYPTPVPINGYEVTSDRLYIFEDSLTAAAYSRTVAQPLRGGHALTFGASHPRCPLADRRRRNRATRRRLAPGSTGPRNGTGPGPGLTRPRPGTGWPGPSPGSAAPPLAGRPARPAGAGPAPRPARRGGR